MQYHSHRWPWQIFFGNCYYDANNDYVVHNEHCGHDFDYDPNISSDVIENAKNILRTRKQQAKEANIYLVNLMNDPNKFTNGMVDISTYWDLWLLLEIPWSFRKDYNLLISLSEKKILLCTSQYTNRLMRNGNYACKYLM